jgi:hypothetical protein
MDISGGINRRFTWKDIISLEGPEADISMLTAIKCVLECIDFGYSSSDSVCSKYSVRRDRDEYNDHTDSNFG